MQILMMYYETKAGGTRGPVIKGKLAKAIGTDGILPEIVAAVWG